MCIVKYACYYLLHSTVVLYTSHYGYIYRGVFTVGIELTVKNNIVAANAIGDYSVVYARTGANNRGTIARCVTGLGPSGSNDNTVLGGVYFNDSEVKRRCAGSRVIISKPGTQIPGVFSIRQCGDFSTNTEGIYTCTMMNSSMIYESIRFGVYFTGRSESLVLYNPSVYHLSSLYTAAPMIDTPSQSKVTVAIGFPFTLSCTSRGSSPDTFTWMKDNDPTVLPSTNITAVDYSSTSAVFRAIYLIDSVTTSDNVTYTCTVTNPIGK